MEVIVIESESFNALVDELTIRVIRNVERYYKEDEWISADEAKRILGIKSKGKLQQMRDNFEIEFSQFGKIIRYSKSSIYAFLEHNRVSIHKF